MNGASRESGVATQAGGPHTPRANEVEAARITPLLLMAAAVSAISSLLYGYDTGIISGALLQIRRQFDLGNGWESIVASSILVGAIIGALFCSWLSERIGRHRTLLILSAIFVVGALGCSLAPSPQALSLGRVVLGFAVGGATQTVPMFVAELAPARRRGQLVLTFQVGIGTGIVLATIVGASQQFSWRTSIGMAAVPAMIMLVLMFWLPESPRWLVKRDDVEGARKILQRVRPPGVDVSGELREITNIESEERRAGETGGWRGFVGQTWIRPAILVGCGIAVFTQLSGIEMIVYYAPTILTENHFGTTAALYVSVGLGVTYLVMMIIGLSIIDHIGRRRLTMLMIPGAAISLAVLGALFITGNHGPKTIGFIIVCLIAFMFFNAGGLQLMGWLTGSEIYPLAVRGAGTSAQAATLWSTNFIITITLLAILTRIGAGPTMWLYAAFNVAAWLFVWRLMPELTGRSLEQIEEKLHAGRFRPQDFEPLPRQAPSVQA
jgi:sugar porter (SP) family MFS transporter